MCATEQVREKLPLQPVLHKVVDTFRHTHRLDMPSITIGGLENANNRDGNLEQISSVVSEEITGQNSISKSTGFAPTLKEVETLNPTMAPNKNSETSGEEKPKSPQKQIKADETINEKPMNGMDDAKGEETEDKGMKDGEMTAEEKRIEYKSKPRASSVEIIGLSKKLARIRQDVLSEDVENTFYTEMKRRASSPAKISYGQCKKPSEKTPGGDIIEGITEELGKMGLDGKEPGFAHRMDGEKKPNELTSKGPVKKMTGFPARQAPYQPTSQYPSTGYQGVAYQKPLDPQLQYMAPSSGQVFQNPTAQPYTTVQPIKVVHPPGQKVVAPGKRQKNQMRDCCIIPNQPNYHSGTPQINMQSITLDSRREPTETTYIWPHSPTNPAYPCETPSPFSSTSDNSEHFMQNEPLPVAYSPASTNSPGHSQLSPMMQSPQSVHSHTDSTGMSTSPNSPAGLEYTTLASPHSVQSVESADSGIASPPHILQYISTSFNSATVMENELYQPLMPQSQGVTNYVPNQMTCQQKQHIPCKESDKEREISKIVETLKSGYNEIPDILNDNANQNIPAQPSYHTKQRGAPVRQARIPQQPVPPGMMPSVQVHPQHPGYNPQFQAQIQAQRQAQMQLQDMENRVNTMPLDLLCSQDEDEDTALHIAISQGEHSLCQAIIKRLVQSRRVDALNIKDRMGQTPLYIAVVTNQPNLVYELLQNGADIMIPTKEGTTPLHYVSTKGYARALRAIGCSLFNGNVQNWNIDIENKHGMSPLQCAIQAHGRYEQIYDGNECRYVNKLVDSNDTVTNLLTLGADPKFQDRRSGHTSLHYAVELAPSTKVTSNVHIIKRILQMATNAMELLGVTNYAGNTPLHVIAGRDYDEDYLVSIIDLLISFGAEIDVKNPDKHYPHDLVNKEKKKKVYARLQGDHMGK